MQKRSLLKRISIHLMFLLIDRRGGFCIRRKVISIHLMFLLIDPARCKALATFLISIHLMFLLIPDPAPLETIFGIYFNTSHVSINLGKGKYDSEIEKHFNTSHVSINRGHPFAGHTAYYISIHLMFLLILPDHEAGTGI